MSEVVIKVENVSKQYRLGQVGTGTISHDLNRWWAKLQGKEDPTLKIGDVNDRTAKGNSDYVWSLKDINFEINKGDAVGIIGRNGAGKSTLLKILSKVTGPTTGHIKVKGRIASLLEVGTGFHPELTGRENIYLNGAILGMKHHEIKRKFDEIVDFSGVERYIDTPVKRYSSGMYVRLAFAVAAHLESEILIVDEVLAVGDAEFQKKCLGKMGDVSKGEGRTVLFVSHNMLAVKSLCNIGLELDLGGLKKTGHIQSIIDSYLNNAQNKLNAKTIFGLESNGIILNSIEVNNSRIDGRFNIEDNLYFKVNFSSKRNTDLININLFFNAMDGTTIFATCSNPTVFESGNHSVECCIPQNTLNDILYSINLMVVESGPKIIFSLNEVLIIEGIEKERDGGWLGQFPGLIRPQYFNWKINKHERI